MLSQKENLPIVSTYISIREKQTIVSISNNQPGTLDLSRVIKLVTTDSLKQFTTFQLEKRKIDIDSLTVVKYIDETGQVSSSYKFQISNSETNLTKFISWLILPPFN